MRPRRRPVEDNVSHDRWLVSYSDFVTLLFALFVVLFASAYRDTHDIIRVSHAIHTGFQKLEAFSDKDEAASAHPDSNADGHPTPPPAKFAPGIASDMSPADLVELRRQLEAAMGAELKNHEVELSVTPEGFVISLKELGFFNSGQAALLPGAAEKIERIANVLSQHGLQLRIEGHSDNQPIHTAQFRSNWELSTARAMSVLQLLVDDAGFDPTKVSVAGFGQYQPIADDSTPEGRRMNRRVDLVVVQTVHYQPTAAPAHN